MATKNQNRRISQQRLIRPKKVQSRNLSRSQIPRLPTLIHRKMLSQPQPQLQLHILSAAFLPRNTKRKRAFSPYSKIVSSTVHYLAKFSAQCLSHCYYLHCP